MTKKTAHSHNWIEQLAACASRDMPTQPPSLHAQISSRLEVIAYYRAEGMTWASISEKLATQHGVWIGDGRPVRIETLRATARRANRARNRPVSLHGPGQSRKRSGTRSSTTNG